MADLALSCNTPPAGTTGTPYTHTFLASGGTPPYVFSLPGGPLPVGLTMDPATGIVTGTPSVAGITVFALQVTDAVDAVVIINCAITIASSYVSLTLSCGSPPEALVNTSYSHALVAAGGTPPYTFASVGGPLPPGIAFNTSTGLFVGVPTVVGIYPLVMQVIDSVGATVFVNCSITVASTTLTASCNNPAMALIPKAYTHTFLAFGGTAPYTFSISVGALPAGLTLNGATGVVSGTPSSPGTVSFTLHVVDAGAGSVSIGCTISVDYASWLWFADFTSSTDGWVALPTDGIEIQYNIWRYWPIADPTADYQVGEVLLETANPANAVQMDQFYNYNYNQDAPSASIGVPQGALAVRGRYFAVLNNSNTAGVVQYAIGLRLSGATGRAGLTQFFTYQWRDFPWTPGQPDGQPVEYGWLEIDVNTNGVDVPMEFQIDGTNAYGPFNVNGTFYNRASTLTLPQSILGRQWRVVPLGGVSGTSTTVQLYSIVPHIYPWTVTPDGMPREFGWLEMELNTAGVSIPFVFQVTGVTGVSNYSFNASGTFDHRFFTIVLPQGMTGTQWRVVPATVGYTGVIQIFRSEARDYPWQNSDYSCPKTFSWLEIQCNTNNASVPMQFQLDGGAQTYNFSVTGTYFNRTNIITLPSNMTGTLWRIVPTTAGYTALIQIFSVAPRFERLPCPITHWDSLGQVFGAVGWRFIYQIWLDYSSTTSLLVSIYRDGNILFYQDTVPAHPQRAIERFYLPPSNLVTGTSVAVFNKSEMYFITLDSIGTPCTSGGQSSTAPSQISCSIKICPLGVTPFQLFRDGSRIEIRPLYEDQRSGFESKIVWELLPLQGI